MKAQRKFKIIIKNKAKFKDIRMHKRRKAKRRACVSYNQSPSVANKSKAMYQGMLLN